MQVPRSPIYVKMDMEIQRAKMIFLRRLKSPDMSNLEASLIPKAAIPKIASPKIASPKGVFKQIGNTEQKLESSLKSIHAVDIVSAAV